MKTLYILNKLEQHYGRLQEATERRIRRQNWLRRIAECAEGGEVALITWSRDCDLCEGTSRRLIAADVRVIDDSINHSLAWADGPMSFRIERPSAPFQATFRDRMLEAFEDGRGSHVVI